MPPWACAADAVASIVVKVAIETLAMRQGIWMFLYALTDVPANCITKFD